MTEIEPGPQPPEDNPDNLLVLPCYTDEPHDPHPWGDRSWWWCRGEGRA